MLLKKNETEVPRLVTIIEELKDGFCTINLEGGFIYANLDTFSIFGKSRTRILLP